jgi:ribosome-associated protein
MTIRDGDLLVERLRRSGPGGQRRNKRETGVRVTHVPTGVTVMATERRSQPQNLEAAKERLARRLAALFHKPKPRKKTRPRAGATEKRLRKKKERSEKKGLRKRVWP